MNNISGKIIKIVYTILLTSTIVTLSILTGTYKREINTLRTNLQHEQAVTDSLIKLPRTLYEVVLNVEDNSKTTLNAKKQSGTVTFPNNKVYELKIDSITVKSKKI